MYFLEILRVIRINTYKGKEIEQNRGRIDTYLTFKKYYDSKNNCIDCWLNYWNFGGLYCC